MPKRITQIYISDNKATATGPVATFMDAIKTKSEATGWEYTRYNDEMIQLFLKKHYKENVLSAYNKLSPYSYKSDLARYCILHRIGGWYMDAGVDWGLNGFNVSNDIKLIAFRDIQKYSCTSWAASSGLFYARSEHPATRKAIDLIVDNTEKKHYGLGPLCPTGPTVWGAAIAHAGLSEGMIIGDLLHLTPTHQRLNTSYLLPDGQIIARLKPHMPQGGRLNECGGQGLNNYNEYWRLKIAFGESADNEMESHSH